MNTLLKAEEAGKQHAGWRYIYPHPDRLTRLLSDEACPVDEAHRDAFKVGYDAQASTMTDFWGFTF